MIEEKKEEAVELREKHIREEIQIIVPELIFLEVINTLKFKGDYKEKLEKANKSLWDMELHVEPMNQFILEKSIQLSINHNLTLYYALYAALAQIHACSLITEDKKLKKFPNAVSL